MVLYHMTIALDGFVTGPGDAMNWIFGSLGAEPNPAAEEVIRTTGAALAGRRSYDVGARSGRRLYGGAWSGPVFVLTHEQPAAAEGVTFLSGHIRAAVATAVEAAGGRNVVLIGADVARRCLEAGWSTRSSSTSRPSCSATASASSAVRTRRRSSWSR